MNIIRFFSFTALLRHTECIITLNTVIDWWLRATSNRHNTRLTRIHTEYISRYSIPKKIVYLYFQKPNEKCWCKRDQQDWTTTIWKTLSKFPYKVESILSEMQKTKHREARMWRAKKTRNSYKRVPMTNSVLLSNQNNTERCIPKPNYLYSQKTRLKRYTFSYIFHLIHHGRLVWWFYFIFSEKQKKTFPIPLRVMIYEF